MAPSRADQPRRTLRSTTMWALAVLTLGAVIATVFMALHLHPVDHGEVRGPGDEAAPQAPADYKRR
jgi:hypothetical protein